MEADRIPLAGIAPPLGGLMVRSSSLCTRAFVVALLLIPAIASAQNSLALRQGVRVRVSTGQTGSQVGNVVSVTADTVKIVAEKAPFALSSFATSDIRRLDRSEGVSAAQGAARGALIGLAAGVLGGVAVGRAFGKNDSMAAAFSVMWGGLGGVAAGAFIGAALGIESWVTLGKPYE